MGTLTADCPRLDAHCPHKLATSCRLTSTPNCCACADNRPHSRTYAVYIDGVGFVQRGTRWQSYCWFCKEFWNNRLAATSPLLQVSDTRIPHNPDQTAFLQRWFEFHQGYRIVTRADGTEDRIAVLGEPFRDVSPGFLPRTLEQLRNQVENDASRAENRFEREVTSTDEVDDETPQQTLEETLDSLLAEASDDEAEAVAAVATTTAPQELDGQEISDMPPQPQPTGLSRPLTRTEATLQRARDRLVRVFGTREDVQRDDYQSPISAMYNRAWERYRLAEQRRDAGTTEAPVLEGVNPLDRLEIEEEILWSVVRESRMEALADHQNYTPRLSPTPSMSNMDSAAPTTSAPPSAAMTAPTSAVSSDLRTSLEQISNEISRLRLASEAVASAREALNAHRALEPTVSLDDQPNRPPALADEEMIKDLSCQICYSQIADIAVLPCGHMIMCQWCAEVVVPLRHSNVTVRGTKCPMCRKTVKQRFKIHIG